MALHWNMEDVKDFEEISEGFEWSVTDAMIWATMLIGMNQITEANADEFFIRLKMSEAINGSPFYATDENGETVDVGWKKEMVDRRIGLRTNATEMTKAKFNGRITKTLREQAERKITQEV